jgi:hypothetical protein
MATIPPCAAGALLIVLGVLSSGAPSPRRPDTEADLLERIHRETNPVRKAKYEIRLGRLELLKSVEAYDKGRLEECLGLLDIYVEHMKSSWATLRSSGRQALRQPQGFKELEIALREDDRRLEDLKHRFPYADRGAVEKAQREVAQIRSEVFRALLPGDRPRQGRKHSGGFSAPGRFTWTGSP